LNAFTSGWKHLKVLWLNETPAHAVQRDVKSEMTLSALRVMAKNCPDLEELSLFVDASIIPEDGLTPADMTASANSKDLLVLQTLAMGLKSATEQPAPTFKKLRYLNLGVSHLASNSHVANYIADCLDTWESDILSETAHVTAPSLSTAPATSSSTPEETRPTSSDASAATSTSTIISPSHSTTSRPKPKPFYFDCSPRFWPAPPVAAELEQTLARRRDNWEDVGKIIPALMEQKVRMQIMRRDMMGLINGLVAMRAGDSGAGLSRSLHI